jgi:hypothetical protein
VADTAIGRDVADDVGMGRGQQVVPHDSPWSWTHLQRPGVFPARQPWKREETSAPRPCRQ